MLEFYPEIRAMHIAAVLISGMLFALRGLGLMLKMKWPRIAPIRYLTYTVDTVLLSAAIMLVLTIEQYPFIHGWLTVKVFLLVIYVFLGVMAFSETRPPRARFTFWLTAVFVYAFIISVAKSHNPWGFLPD